MIYATRVGQHVSGQAIEQVIERPRPFRRRFPQPRFQLGPARTLPGPAFVQLRDPVHEQVYHTVAESAHRLGVELERCGHQIWFMRMDLVIFRTSMRVRVWAWRGSYSRPRGSATISVGRVGRIDLKGRRRYPSARNRRERNGQSKHRWLYSNKARCR